MKNTLIVSIFIVASILLFKLYRTFEVQEDAAIKIAIIGVLSEHGGTPVIIPQKVKTTDTTIDSILIYHTRIEISREELRALLYLSKYYDIKLQTE